MDNQPPTSLKLATVIIFLSLILGSSLAFADCKSNPSWFPHSKTPEPDNEGFSSSSNCEFHQWSWQTFLWLTEEVDGKPRFLSFVSPHSLVRISADGSTFRMKKGNTPEPFDEYLQAGTDGIMVDQQGRAVYYSQYLNKEFVDFILSNKLTQPDVVLHKFNPETPFPIGAIELKASWKIVQEGEDTSDMFTMNGVVNKLVNKDGKISVDPTQTEEVKLALVGFHIGGVVKGHPEMIWATFEHQRNAPNVPKNVTPNTVISKQDWTFYQANTPYKNCNVNMAKSNKLQLDEKTQTLSPVTQVCREFEFGNDSNSKDKNVITNDQNIADLNADVLSHLNEDDVWRNYFEVGAIWFKGKDKLKPNMPLDTDEILTGSLKLSNATIETYTQIQSTMNNCFRCHNTEQSFTPGLHPLPGLNINISRAFQNIYFWSQDSRDAK